MSGIESKGNDVRPAAETIDEVEPEETEGEAPAFEHEPDCWRYSQCWCGAEEDFYRGGGER